MTNGTEESAATAAAAKADVEAPAPSTETSRGKAALGTAAVAAPAGAAALAGKRMKMMRAGGWKRGLAVFDFLLRLSAIAAALAAATAMGTSGETLPFFSQFFQFQANYNDLPAFTFFVVGNAISSGYLVLSLPFSIVGIVRPAIVGVRLLLLIFDTVMLALTTASAASATAIVYLAHKGNSSANWIAICQQFNDFCQRISGAVVASAIAAFIFILLVLISAMILRKH